MSSILSQTVFSVEKPRLSMYYVAVANKNAAFLKLLQQLMDAQDPPWSNADLSRATKMSEGAITNFFKGVRKPSRQSIEKIAKAFGVSNDFLMENADSALPGTKEALPEYALEVIASMKKLDKARRYELMVIARSFVAASNDIAEISDEEFISLAMDIAEEMGEGEGAEQVRQFLTALETKRKGLGDTPGLPELSAPDPG